MAESWQTPDVAKWMCIADLASWKQADSSGPSRKKWGKAIY
jgi:hypothetical protein